MTPTDGFEWIARVAAGLVGLGVIWRYAVRPPIEWARRVADAVGKVEAQFSNNGGSTARASLDRIESMVDDLHDVVRSHGDRLARLELPPSITLPPPTSKETPT